MGLAESGAQPELWEWLREAATAHLAGLPLPGSTGRRSAGPPSHDAAKIGEPWLSRYPN